MPDTSAYPTKSTYRFSVAPMMDWTDRHCRMFHRALSKDALLWTEMVTADAVIHGDRERLIIRAELVQTVDREFGPDGQPIPIPLLGDAAPQPTPTGS